MAGDLAEGLSWFLCPYALSICEPQTLLHFTRQSNSDLVLREVVTIARVTRFGCIRAKYRLRSCEPRTKT